MSFVITYITQDYRGYRANKTERGWETYIYEGRSVGCTELTNCYLDINIAHATCIGYNASLPGHIVEEFQ